ncbi:Cyclic nucleotide-binding domain-containing protein [Plasmodiophora brassicae]
MPQRKLIVHIVEGCCAASVLMSSMLEELRELSELLKDDIITPSEFDDMKRALITRYKGSGTTGPSHNTQLDESNEDVNGKQEARVSSCSSSPTVSAKHY